jgi:hypothetical protein
MREQEATCTAATCLKSRQHFQLQHDRKGSNMSGYNMLEQAATWPATTCWNRLQHHAAFCYNSYFYGLLAVIFFMSMSLLSWIVALPTKLKILRVVGDIAKHF